MIAQANQICKQLNTEFAADKPANSGISEIVRVGPHRAVLEARAVRELGKLTPPGSLAQNWRIILQYRRTLAQELVLLVKDAKAGDVKGIRTLTVTKEQVHKKLSELATREGLTDCAHIGS